MLLRKTLVEKLDSERELLSQKKESPGNKTCLSLSKPGSSLRNPIAAISISHCPVFGGFVFSFDKGASLGFDVEIKKRVSAKALSRISTKKELAAAPSPPAALWTAKEAAFKCAGAIDRKLKFLNECGISNWNQKKSKIYCFSFETNQSVQTKGQGFVWLFKGKALALAAIKPAGLSNRIKQID